MNIPAQAKSVGAGPLFLIRRSHEVAPPPHPFSSGGTTSTYDFENYMLTHGAVSLTYDGDGNRVSETVGGVTTKFLVDDLNPTGYSQVVDELVNGAVTRTYTYGRQLISENQLISGTWTPSFYGYDGRVPHVSLLLRDMGGEDHPDPQCSPITDIS